MNRYFLKIAYVGTHFHGWQIQPGVVTVQGVLNDAISKLLKEETFTMGCGRTDAGVHAKEFFLHFDAQIEIEDKAKFCYSLNSMIGYDIVIYDLVKMHDDAHTRFDANYRAYEYHIHLAKDPFVKDFSSLLKGDVDIDLLNEAAKVLFDFEDFSSFSKSETQTMTNNCKIFRSEWVQNGDNLAYHVAADRFLRNMVRALVGTQLLVGQGKISVEDFRNIIIEKNRSSAGKSVDAKGLYLCEVKYPYLMKNEE